MSTSTLFRRYSWQAALAPLWINAIGGEHTERCEDLGYVSVRSEKVTEFNLPFHTDLASSVEVVFMMGPSEGDCN